MLQHDTGAAYVQSGAMRRTGERPYEGEDLSDPTGAGEPHKLRSFANDEIKRWVKYLCWGMDVTPTELARRIGIAGTTLSRPLNKDVPFRLSASTLERLETEARGRLGHKFYVEFSSFEPDISKLATAYRSVPPKNRPRILRYVLAILSESRDEDAA